MFKLTVCSTLSTGILTRNSFSKTHHTTEKAPFEEMYTCYIERYCVCIRLHG